MAIDIDAFLQNADRQDQIPPSPGLTRVYFGQHAGARLMDLPEDYVAWCIHPNRLIDTEHNDWYYPFLQLHQEYENWRVLYDAYNPASVTLWFGQHEGNPFSVIYDDHWSLWWHRHESMQENKWYYRFKELAELCQAIDARNAQFYMTHSAAEVAAAMARIHAAGVAVA